LPLYAYRCTQCDHRFEKIQSFSSEPELECPKCRGLLERPLTAPRLQFKGAGWYVNDYAPGASSSTTESTATSSPTETKAPSTAKESAPSGTPAPAAPPAPAAS
jgi:putative FmdB family regulatory protein